MINIFKQKSPSQNPFNNLKPQELLMFKKTLQPVTCGQTSDYA
jgi:hypothetical protein